MNNLVTNYRQIMDSAAQLQIPANRPRAAIREYLQSLIISLIYSQPLASKLIFTGGTSLRLLRGLDRFSEDLDFDNLGLSEKQLDRLLQAVSAKLKYQNLAVELVVRRRENKHYYEIRFPGLLHQLQISTNPKEKLMFKIDYSRFWKGNRPETKLFSRYGFLEQVLTNSLDQMLVQKLAAYVNRSQTLPRDLYDLVWLFGQGARLDPEFIQANRLPDLIGRARAKYQSEGIPASFRSRLKPFLFSPESLNRLKLFPEVIKSLGK